MEVDLPAHAAQRLQDLPPAAAAVVERLGHGFTPVVWLVGGAVRDLLLGQAPADVDLVVDGPLEAVLEALGRRLRDHDRFATATVAVGGDQVDLARSRRESYGEPGALPDIEPAGIECDLLRRDFTVNALALALTGPRRGRLLGVPNALEDLQAGRLRVLHDASFRDDPTRLLRLARYAARLGFAPDPRTLGLAGAAVAAGALGTVSAARIGNELRLLAREDDPTAGFMVLGGLGLSEAIAAGFGISDRGPLARAERLLPADGRREVLVLAWALTGVEPQRRAVLLDELAFTAGDRDAILQATALAPALSAALRSATRPSEISSAVGGAGPETVALAGGLGTSEPAREWLDHLRHVRLAIGGDDLLASGLPPGPAIGVGLRAALRATLDGEAPDRDRQLSVAVRAASEAAGGVG